MKYINELFSFLWTDTTEDLVLYKKFVCNHYFFNFNFNSQVVEKSVTPDSLFLYSRGFELRRWKLGFTFYYKVDES